MKVKKPNEGDRVELVRTYPTEQPPVQALVDWVGSSQFSAEGADGVRYMVGFTGSTQWRVMK